VVRRAADASSAPANARFVRKHIVDLAPYTPIVPFEVLSEQLGRAPEDIVKLDANENPYGPPPEVSEALASLKFPHIYPDPESRALRAALADDCGVDADCLLVGCGADELIDLLMRVVLDPDDVIVNTPPTFGMYAFDCAVNAGRVVDVPRGDASEGFRVDVEGCTRAVLDNDAKLLFLTSPNNPDGSVMRDDDLDELLKLPCLVVLDEAYVEFSGTSASRIAEVATRENLIVLRTFSKRAALAGMRVGYGAFPRGIIEYMWRAKQPYNVSVAAEVAACAALSNPEYLEDVKTKLVNERARLRETLDACPFLTPYDSHANFILCRVDGDRDALEVKNALAERGIMVRHYVKPASISGCIRISVGKPEQTDALKEALDAM
jgi:histidinol-phosphate aminotransferase